MAKQQSERMEIFFMAVITDRLKGVVPSLLRFVLKNLSRLYRWIMSVRLWAYEKRILRPKILGCQVISIGNLTVGGTGKTPVVEVFARALQQNGRRVAILSRGYKSVSQPSSERWKRFLTFNTPQVVPPRVVSDGHRILLDSGQGGDEPYMLATNLPDVCVIVDKDRVKGGRYAIQKLGCDTLILDDGFQYLRLQHRLDIVLVDRNNPFDNGYVLPRGLLRESQRHLRRASFIFITKSHGDGSPELRKEIRKYNDHAEIAECRHTPTHLRGVYSTDRQPLDFLQGKTLAAISGIAAPRGFEDSLERLGGTIVFRRRFPDHHRYEAQEIIDTINDAKARGAELIVTTEKDAVRFPHLSRIDVPVYFLRIEIQLLSGAESFQELIARICFKAQDGNPA
ncbi:MAG: tetraacyldisaccharide 4'-kinase [Kiritimatiellae bacterium]|nr:tetraacyldisaccharide 4'-kinase [Kiritimatiellia bacterium]